MCKGELGQIVFLNPQGLGTITQTISLPANFSAEVHGVGNGAQRRGNKRSLSSFELGRLNAGPGMERWNSIKGEEAS